ncbi:MAG: CoA transferase, partial [Candidatus Tectomicrobia bacterium]|nr:CoA transferase [Candidatus Tectomicrobia bacterium]
PTVAPHNAYRTHGGGHNDWCVIACFSDAEWQKLVDLMGCPGWATGATFANLSGRLQHQEELDEGIERWTQTIEKYELTEKCQAVGVRAMPVQSAEDRVERDPQLRARGMYPELVHPLLGRRKVQSVPFKHSRTPAAVHTPAPLIGQHTRKVMQELLGLSLDDIRAGYTDGTFWPKDMPLYPYLEETLR